MNLLLDSRVFLWWDGQAPELSEIARNAIRDPANHVFISAVSVWEIAIRRRLCESITVPRRLADPSSPPRRTWLSWTGRIADGRWPIAPCVM